MPVFVQSRKEGFRRCGVAHSAERTEYPDDHWTAEQLAELKAEKQLMVVEVQAATADLATADQATTDDPENPALVAADPATKPAKK